MENNMSLLSNLTDNDLEETGDVLGGRHVFDSNIYPATIKAAYIIESASGALGVGLNLITPEGDYSETIYATNKNKQNFYLNNNKKKCPLPGFTLINDLCLLETKKPLSEQDTEEKALKLWDFTEKKEVVKQVPVLVNLTGTVVNVAILKQKVNKKVKDGDKYVDSSDTIEENRINKFFDLNTNQTVTEIKNDKEAKFYESWLNKYKGECLDKSKSVSGHHNSAQSNQANVKPKKSLFE